VLAELSGPGTTAAKWTDYLSVGNAKVGMRVLQAASETLNLRYFHTDHLGSISVITNESGVVQERLSFDAWGKRRNPDGTDDTAGSITSQTTRGFTGQEELSVAGLVHLNGRVYDPLLARMTSPDPTVTDPSNPQGWNRYSYVGNDPLAFTDPNGFSWLSEFFHSVANFINSIPILRSIVQIAATIFLNAVLPGAGTLVTAALAAAGGAAIANGLSGGNLASMLKSAAISGLTAIAMFGVGEATAHGLDFRSPDFNPGMYAANVAGHAAVGCGSSLASGGSCQSGALSGAMGAAVSPLLTAPTDVGALVRNTAISATAGGLGAIAGGGKFADGAVTGAFGYLFNAAGDKINQLNVGNDAHRTLQDYARDFPGTFVESSTDGMGTNFGGRVDIGNRDTLEIWEIKPNNSVGLFSARVEAEFYSIVGSAGGRIYQPGGQPGFMGSSVTLPGTYGVYTYTFAGDGAILYTSNLRPEYVYAPYTRPSIISPPAVSAGTVLRSLRMIPVVP
jgi:RHS repeat-associated protein